MTWSFSPYLLPVLLAVVVSVGLAYYAWKQRSVPGAWPIVFLALAVAEWSLGYALELAVLDRPSIIFWARIQYFGIVSAPVAWFFLALAYTGRERWLRGRNLIRLAIVPATTLLLLWTNDELIWREIAISQVGSLPVLAPTYGPWFWVHSAYSYLLMLGGTLLLLWSVNRGLPLYHRQTFLLVLSAVLPWLGNALYIFDLIELDLTPFAFVGSNLLLGLGILRFHFLELVPIARRMIIDRMSDAVFVVDQYDRIVDANPATEGVIGRPPMALLGQKLDQLLVNHSDKLKALRENKETYTEINLGAGSDQRSYDLRLSPLADYRGHPRGWIVVLRDITERKRLEEYMLRSEPLVAMGRMAAVMAHEIRNPLHAIRGFVELVMDFSIDSEEREQYLRFCYQELVRLSETTDRMLNLANPSQQVRETVAINEMLDRTLTLVDRSVEEAAVQFTVHCSGQQLLVQVNRAQIVQVLLNLLINALEATPGGGRIDISLEPVGDQVLLVITNYGVSIPQEIMDRIFEPFFTTKPQGNGLGLSVSQSIIEEHGGTLTVRNLEHEPGVAFSMMLPRIEARLEDNNG